ncbi:DUF4430 domain-containing protein [Caloramator sp. ALD01]|uniref:DUF4430 domain-containing protein n=1 Tax=Caloramator sp. ALD01 TaxID=1031288 RepID=UPI00042819EA|nr:DUF4430 domain-containing protein [Caloramator sp. ALD01]
MKKKLLLIVVMLVLSVTAISFAGSLQNILQRSEVENIELNNKEGKKVEQRDQNKDKVGENRVKDKSQDNDSAVVKQEQNKASEIKKEKSKNSTKSINKNGESRNKTEKSNVSNDNKSTTLKPNVYIIDTVNNKVIYKGYVDINSKTAGDVTLKVLIDNKISYRAKGTGGSIYFSSIAGLKERDYGANSGWCYFVNGVKPSVGAGSYTLKDGDVLEWKFLEDGLK